MWFRRIFSLLALAVLASTGLQAQIYPALSKLPWNKYVCSRIPDGYTTIIGQSGTQLFSGSQTAGGSTVFSWPTPGNFPISFKFIGTTYPAGSTTPKVCAAGYISFNGSTSGSANPRLDYNTGATSLMIMPFWSDVQPSGVSEGGVYWRVDGVVGNRILTVEWRVQGIAAPTRNPGQFQAKLYESSGKIEYFYGSNSVDRLYANGTQGAAVGIKKYGYLATLPNIADPDDDKFILALNPDLVRDTVAVTRTRNMFYEWFVGLGGAYFPETYASWTFGNWGQPVNPPPLEEGQLGRPSRFFHYGFPTTNGVRNGYRFTQVDNDVATDSAAMAPVRAGNAYSLGSNVTISARFVNIGVNSRQNVPVQIDVYRVGTPGIQGTRFDTAFRVLTPQFGTDYITFSPPVGPPTTSNYGTYIAKIYSKLNTPADEDRSNDTLSITFYISYPHDVMGYSIIQPVTFSPIFPQVYPVGYAVPVEARFLNIGTNIESNVPVGYTIFTAAGLAVYSDNSGIVRGAWNPLEFRDVSFAGWTPTAPGDYYIRIYTMLANDDQTSNDTFPSTPPGKKFTVQYEIEIEAQSGGLPGSSPIPNSFPQGDYPDGRPIDITIGFKNNGFTDATNVPSVVQIRNGATNQLVYNRTALIPNIPGDGSITFRENLFPKFIPNGSGTYCLTAWATDAQDPIRGNDTTRWCFTVKPRLSGTIYVGLGERYRSIQEAGDSLQKYGVAGRVDFILVDDAFIVRPTNNDASNPAYDFRGDVIGLGPANPVTWTAADGKDSVQIILKSPSGIGFYYGQGGPRRGDTSNPSGYQTWDGGPRKKLRFILDTAGFTPGNRAYPFFFGSGSSNYSVLNSYIRPASTPIGKKTNTLVAIPAYNQTFNSFTYVRDLSLQSSAGIFLRNSAPQDATGNNSPINGRTRDTLRNQNNNFSGNVISDFGYGILSIGAGPLYRVGNPVDRLYEEYSNGNNAYDNNTISDVGRAGVFVAYEQNSSISNNRITRVENTNTAVLHAAGIWASSGGQSGIDTVKNRAYSTGLKIERNKINQVNAYNGVGAGIWTQTAENAFSSQIRVFRFPTNSATNNRVWNNMIWNFAGQTAVAGTGVSVGIGMTIAENQRTDLLTTGNRMENNTIFNQIAGNAPEYGLLTVRNAVVIRNNIISLVSATTTNGIGLAAVMPNYKQNLVSDYNLFQTDSGSIGALVNLAGIGYQIPSPPVARTLNQWRALTGLDSNSLTGNVLADFTNTTPGQVDLHIRPGILGSLANNRGIPVAGQNTDIDGDPRAAGGNLNRPDIGADEFSGAIRNNDLLAEDLLTPFGYRAVVGQYSDAEYVMTDSMVPLVARFTNMGGLPQTLNTVTLKVERWTGSLWTSAIPNVVRTSSFNVAQSRDILFGSFMPATLRELGQNDPFYGTNPNVSPLYRFTATSGNDDFNGNNIYTKTVRFYVQRSTRKAIVAVEKYMPGAVMPASAVDKSNKLNSDSLMAALTLINWERADGVAKEDFDLFERDKWPATNLNFKPWKTVIWAQGAEPQGLEPEERAALKTMLNSRSIYDRANLIMAGQNVARIHDVALSPTNGMASDQDFSQNYLRANYVGNTVPVDYSNRHIRGVAVTPGKYEKVTPTGVVGDNPPNPGLLHVTLGQGIARPSHNFTEQTLLRPDSAAGVATAAPARNVIYYSIDWRHYGRFAFEPTTSGGQRLLLAAIDFIDQYNGVLPIKLVSFDAYQSGRGQKAVSIEFETAEELNIAGLEVERAVVQRTEQGEAVGSYTLVDRRTPAGSATTGAAYRVSDRNVEYGVEYRYRLVTVGLDGQRTVDASKTVNVLGLEDAAAYNLTVAPNPVRTSAVVSLRVPDGTRVRVQLFDATGRLVKDLANNAEGLSTVELNVTDLASGVYTVRLETSNGVTLSEKLTVQK